MRNLQAGKEESLHVSSIFKPIPWALSPDHCRTRPWTRWCYLLSSVNCYVLVFLQNGAGPSFHLILQHTQYTEIHKKWFCKTKWSVICPVHWNLAHCAFWNAITSILVAYLLGTRLLFSSKGPPQQPQVLGCLRAQGHWQWRGNLSLLKTTRVPRRPVMFAWSQPHTVQVMVPVKAVLWGGEAGKMHSL